MEPTESPTCAGATRCYRPVAVWLGVLGLALIARLAWAALVPVQPFSDPEVYDSFAWNLARGAGYAWDSGDLTAYWPVGTSAIYALLFRLFGHDYMPILVWNIFLGMATTAAVMAATRLWFGTAAGIAAGLLCAVWPTQVQFTTILASELPYNLFAMAGVLAWITRGSGIGKWVACGVCFAVASYIRPVGLLLPVVLGGADVLAGRRGWREAGLGSVVSLAVMAALIAPWAWRNTQLFGQFVLISTNGGTNLWMGNNSQADGAYMPLPHEGQEGMDEAEREAHLKEEALRFIRENPGQFARLVARRVYLFYRTETIGVGWNEQGLLATGLGGAITPLKAASVGFWYLALFCGIAGAVLLFREEGFFQALFHPAMLLWLYYMSVHAVVVSGARYHFPVIPLIASLGGLALARGWVRWFPPKTASPGIP